MSDGFGIYCRRWTPEGSQKGTVCIVHGLGEHCGRYDRVAEQLAGAGYATRGLDLRGFGKSEGRRGNMRFAKALKDIDEILAEERERADGRPLFLYGHSLGGLLALLYELEYHPVLAGIVGTGPAVHTVLRNQRAKVLTVQLLGTLLPSVTISSGLDETKLSRDPAELGAYRADPLVHKRTSLGFAGDAFRAMDRVLRDAGQLRLPLLLIHGGADEVNLVAGSSELAARHPGDCTLKVYEGVFHSVEHEPERVAIINDIIAWMDAHLPSERRPD